MEEGYSKDDYMKKLKETSFKKGVYVATRYYVDKSKFIRVLFHLQIYKDEHYVTFTDLIWKKELSFFYKERFFKITAEEFELLKDKGRFRLPITVDFDAYLYEPEVELLYFRSYEDIYSLTSNEATMLYSYVAEQSLEELKKYIFAIQEEDVCPTYSERISI